MDESERSVAAETPSQGKAHGSPLLEIEDLVVTYRARHRPLLGHSAKTVALDGADLTIHEGETVGVVGESGSGKSTLARTVMGLVRPASGRICFMGRDITYARGEQLRALRRQMQMVFQDPYGSVNPLHTVHEVIAEPLDNYHSDWTRSQRNERIDQLLARVQLAQEIADRSVLALSGGQLQRVGIARALALGPRLLVADEAVSALDVSIQAQILNLLADLKRTEQIAMVFITHNLAVAEYVADRIAVLYAGRIVELGDAHEVITSPRHPYAKELRSAVPGFTKRQYPVATGQPDSPAAQPGSVGCPFRHRCPEASDICGEVTPPLEAKRPAHLVACHAVPVERAPAGGE